MWSFEKCAVVVAHPDDETLWAGGTILLHPDCEWTVVTICRDSDPNQASKFSCALERLNALGAMGELEDDLEGASLATASIQSMALELLTSHKLDLVITHGIWGECTHHRRHEEISKAVSLLWKAGRLQTRHLWRFAYEDSDGRYPPRAIESADIRVRLPEEIWQKKHDIITGAYEFSSDRLEATGVPRDEAFWSVGE
ncbi:MAG: PIG-L deacetylase family protein [Planctomycetota bacterium]|jgi:LmbE family N-acetylglucosaminyl deacetylase